MHLLDLFLLCFQLIVYNSGLFASFFPLPSSILQHCCINTNVVWLPSRAAKRTSLRDWWVLFSLLRFGIPHAHLIYGLFTSSQKTRFKHTVQIAPVLKTSVLLMPYITSFANHKWHKGVEEIAKKNCPLTSPWKRFSVKLTYDLAIFQRKI